MRIDIASPDGNTFVALYHATRLMQAAHRKQTDIDALRLAVMGARSAVEARDAITAATFGCITFYNSAGGVVRP